ncbi:MAG: rhomboid family intramembrane serine protease [Thermoanaerobaculia bacterium]|nr:rhomboid family intramembrane serine protease [Thermoanaerobaculia bacterium]
MFQRQTTGSVVCPNCGRLVGVLEPRCLQCGRPRPGLWGYGPAIQKLTGNMRFGDVVMWGCILMLLASLLYDVEGIRSHGLLSLFAPSTTASFVFGDSGAIPVFFFGRWWTVLSASFLHGGLLHIGFNLYYLRFLLPATEEQFGIGRTIMIYTAASVAGFGLTSFVNFLVLRGAIPAIPRLMGAPFTLGASASLCGLLGALWVMSRVTGRTWASRQIVQAAIFILVIGFLIPGIDNLAHIGGFVGGAVAAKLLRPLHEENIYHLAGGLLCMVAFFLSIAASIFLGLEQKEIFQQFMHVNLPGWL